MPTPKDGTRVVQTPLILLAALALATLPVLTHARNRLLSGRPLSLPETLALAPPSTTIALLLALAALLTPLIRPNTPTRLLALAGTALALAALALLAGQSAATLAATAPPAARTSLGAAWWTVFALLLLSAADTHCRLALKPLPAALTALLIITPLALVLASGALAPLALLREYQAQRPILAAAFQRHLLLVAGSLLPTLLIGLPLGIAAQRRPRLRAAALTTLNIVQTIPSIALFGLLIAPLAALAAALPVLSTLGIGGIGLAPALIALVLYSLLPIVRNTIAGLDGIPPAIRESGTAMGLTPSQLFWQVDARLALPAILAGLRVTAVQATGLAAISALIGAGGLGAIIFQGLFANALDLVLLGTIPVILLALAIDLLFRTLATWSALPR